MLLREFWNGRFWPYCTANLRESTCVGYEPAWRLHVAPRFGAMQMESISVELVDKWLAGFASSGAARKAWAVLRAILRRAIRWNLLDVDITRRDIRLPAKPHYEPVILGIRQQRSLLQGFYDHPLEAWLICAVSCGLRTEEGLQPVNLIACFRLFSYDILESCVSGNGRGVRASTSRRYGSGAVRTACPSHLSA